MTDARWIEHVRCPNCGKTGQAELVEVSQFNNRFEIVPIDFKVITAAICTARPAMSR
jgi:hypothetical protein